MNENIQRIAEATNFTIADSPVWRLKVQEFAQAIVQECADIAHTAEPYQSSDNILKHFGVE
jgi:hypothetical protein